MRLASYLNLVSPLFGTLSMAGFARSGAIAKHLQVAFELNFRRVDSLRSAKLITRLLGRNDLSEDALRTTCRVIRTAFLAAPPLYIGIAARQSLRSRLQQHIAGDSGVARSLSAAGIPWRYINFRCTVLAGIDEREFRALEKLVQTVFKPQLSMR